MTTPKRFVIRQADETVETPSSSAGATKKRGRMSRGARQALGLVGAAVVIAGLVCTGVWVASGPLHDVLTGYENPGPQLSLQETGTLGSVKALSDVDALVDQKMSTEYMLAGDLADLRAQSGDGVVREVLVSNLISEDCVNGWAEDHFVELATEGTYAVLEVCGDDALVAAGPAGVTTKSLIYGLQQESGVAPDGGRTLILDSDTETWTYVALSTPDEGAWLFVLAPER